MIVTPRPLQSARICWHAHVCAASKFAMLHASRPTNDKKRAFPSASHMWAAHIARNACRGRTKGGSHRLEDNPQGAGDLEIYSQGLPRLFRTQHRNLTTSTTVSFVWPRSTVISLRQRGVPNNMGYQRLKRKPCPLLCYYLMP
jgi:hypothetical protein